MTKHDLSGTQLTPSKSTDEIGYKRPPVRSRFRPGVSGNPTGRPKGSQNLGTLFHKILREEVSLREGNEVRKVSKAEAVVRAMVLSAMKGDPKNVVTLFRLAEHTGELAPPATPLTSITRIIISPPDSESSGQQALPANSEINRE
jgi:hypothetical protein